MPNSVLDIARIVFREILDGDRRKFIAESNDLKTGGGARDIRFRGWDKLEPVFRKMFPNIKKLKRQRNNKDVELDGYAGELHWKTADGQEIVKEIILETPTTARDDEARITRVPEYDCFRTAPAPKEEGRLLLLLVQNPDNSVWPVFVTEKSLEKGGWHPAVAEFLLTALKTKRPVRNAAYGYVDFTTNEKFIK